jgi:hypothetical protein
MLARIAIIAMVTSNSINVNWRDHLPAGPYPVFALFETADRLLSLGFFVEFLAGFVSPAVLPFSTVILSSLLNRHRFLKNSVFRTKRYDTCKSTLREWDNAHNTFELAQAALRGSASFGSSNMMARPLFVIFALSVVDFLFN